MIVRDQKGNVLLEMIRGCEEEILGNSAYRPLTASLLVVKSPQGFLLLKNRYRKEWELPGGMIEAGETPACCAQRECLEESGYAVPAVRFTGLLKLFLVPDFFNQSNRIEYISLYCADVDTCLPFRETEEMTDLCWYRPGDPITDADVIDLKLLEYYTPA